MGGDVHTHTKPGERVAPRHSDSGENAIRRTVNNGHRGLIVTRVYSICYWVDCNSKRAVWDGNGSNDCITRTIDDDHACTVEEAGDVYHVSHRVDSYTARILDGVYRCYRLVVFVIYHNYTS